jgi:hypothetical protein
MTPTRSIPGKPRMQPKAVRQAKTKINQENPMEPDVTMREIERAAQARAQLKIEAARTALREAERHLWEIAGSPLFGNGIASGLKEAYAAVDTTAARLQGLQTMIGQRFARPAKDDVSSTSSVDVVHLDAVQRARAGA